jgi:hypothetical protein
VAGCKLPVWHILIFGEYLHPFSESRIFLVLGILRNWGCLPNSNAIKQKNTQTNPTIFSTSVSEKIIREIQPSA